MKFGIFMIVLIVTALLLAIYCSGCSGGFKLPWQKSASVINVPPDAGQQLWTTVKKSNWLVTLAIPIIALGAVAMFNGAGKLGMSAIIFGCVNLFMALATARFALWMAVFGLVGSGLAVAVSILAKNKALKEIITGVQEYKGSKTSNEVLNGALAATQSTPTQRLVQKIKTELKFKGAFK